MIKALKGRNTGTGLAECIPPRRGARMSRRDGTGRALWDRLSSRSWSPRTKKNLWTNQYRAREEAASFPRPGWGGRMVSEVCLIRLKGGNMTAQGNALGNKRREPSKP